jgi:uncharacterized membrane protein
VGIAGAVAASYLGVAYRHAAARRKIPDVAAALLEDALAIGLGLASVRSGAS